MSRQRYVRFAALFGVLLATSVARAAIFTVTSGANSGGGSLRTAINGANGTPGSTIRFAIPTSDSRYSAATGVFTIQITSTLPAITAAGTILDGTTQATAIGNTNPGTLGAGGTVGVDALSLSTVPRPEILIHENNGLSIGLDIRAANVTIRGIAIYGFGDAANSDSEGDIRVGAVSGALIEQNVIGSTATSFTDPGGGNRSTGDHIRVVGGDSGIIRNNLIGYSVGKGIELNSGANGWLIENNEFRRNAIGTNNLDHIDVENGSGATTIRGNLLVQADACGVDSYQSSGGNTIVNNTVQGNGVGAAGSGLETAGIRLYGAANVVDRNIVTGNVGAGVMVTSGSTNNQITRNSIYGNGPSTGQVGIDLLAAADDQNQGTTPFLTRNDSGDGDTGGNGLLNFPVLATAAIDATSLTLTGFARPGSSIEVFLAAADASGFGEGQTYLFTATEGSVADTDATTGTYTNPVNGVNQGTDTTNRFRFVVSLPAGVSTGSTLTATATVGTATSEFSGNVTVTGAPTVTLVKSVSPTGNRPPGTDLNYTVVFANTGTGTANSVVVNDPVPANTDFKLGSVFTTPGTTGLTVVVAYSNDSGSTWTYTPVSLGGGAPAGYDRNVTNVRWTFTGNLGYTSPTNQGNVGFSARIR